MAEVRNTTVFTTVAFVHSAIPPYGGQPRHYRNDKALCPEIRGRSFLSVLLDTDQLQTNSLLSHRLVTQFPSNIVDVEELNPPAISASGLNFPLFLLGVKSFLKIPHTIVHR